MKKLLATAILGLASVTAMAGSASVEYSNIDGVNGAKNGTGYLINFNDSITKHLDGGFQMSTAQTDGTNAVSTRVEANLTPKYDLGKVTVYAKGTYGTKLSTAGTTDYYAIEPGVIVPVTGDISIKAGYRFRSAFDDKVADTTRTERLGVTYALTKKDAFTVRYDRQRGDSNQNSWNFAYTRGF
jgi:hypothetical protein